MQEVAIPQQPLFDFPPPQYVTNVNEVPQEPVIIPEIVNVPQDSDSDSDQEE